MREIKYTMILQPWNMW